MDEDQLLNDNEAELEDHLQEAIIPDSGEDGDPNINFGVNNNADDSNQDQGWGSGGEHGDGNALGNGEEDGNAAGFDGSTED